MENGLNAQNDEQKKSKERFTFGNPLQINLIQTNQSL